jgi:hypothetical protein
MLAWKNLFATLTVGVGAISAHIGPGSLNIKGGEKYMVGQVVDISFLQVERHSGKYDLKFSKDGGTTWTSVVSGWTSASGNSVTVTYKWTVPNMPTTTAKFQVCQLAGACTDPDYGLISNNFTVSAASTIQVKVLSNNFSPSGRNYFDALGKSQKPWRMLAGYRPSFFNP